MNILLPTKRCTTELCSAVVHPQDQSPFWLLKAALEHVHVRLLPKFA
jgi:hypothetical protein